MSDFVLRLLTRFPMARWSPVPLRLIVGYGFMQHGFAKLSRGPDAFAAILQTMGVPEPHFMAWLTIVTELLGGLAVLLGAFVTIVSVPMMAVLAVAMFKVHLPYGFSSIKLLAVTATGAQFGPVGYEVILLYFACLAALVVGGSGPFAVDGLIARRLEARTRTSRVPISGSAPVGERGEEPIGVGTERVQHRTRRVARLGESFTRHGGGELRGEGVVAPVVQVLERREREERVELAGNREAGEVEVEPAEVAEHVDRGVDAEQQGEDADPVGDHRQRRSGVRDDELDVRDAWRPCR